ncbi:ABC transporter substrate-binding protein [Caldovatus aquaticus]|uniref:ABC transporter substrate-binding protein n=1 Tax=Caldovatus aquaticus TaxID=2865671 RepID=A0ABS7F509_9PROT|nr:ABC transporter substrate-binding protein [Caldovatus aquaticus]MBW8269845.1 ABC transporter substrate-binding protein [Caldovatus aquaticus]
MDHPRSQGAAWSRRRVLETGLKGAAATALGAHALAPDTGLAAEVPLEFDGRNFQLAAPEPNPKRGGVLRYGITSRPPHFDVHQSGTINNLGSQGCMFDNLVRRDPRDSGRTIIPDLAHSWEIARDGRTYTFHLRRGVLFHDGAELTAEDVKATYDRIVRPPREISIPRSSLFTAVSEINARDRYTVEFKLSEPRPASFMMGAFASGWNVILRKKTLEDNNYNLRRVVTYPGTGPFRPVRRVENEVWAMERNPNYWNRGLPYLDGIEFYHALPFSPELGSALLAGRTDYARLLDPVSLRRVKQTPGMSGTDFYQSVIQAAWVNARRRPFDDPRVRRALHLVLDRAVLVDVVKDVAPMMVGGFIYPFSEFATPREEMARRLGYQADAGAAVREARALLAAAGQGRGIRGLDFLIRDVATFKLWAQAIQAMLQQTLNVECRLRTVVESVWFDDVRNGNYDLAIGAIVSTLIDPSDYFNAWYKDGGPQNYSNWKDPRFEALLPQIDREVDRERRLALIRQAEAIMEENPPLLPVAWEKINDGWYNYVKGHVPYDYFGIYDCVRMDTFWLDK